MHLKPQEVFVPVVSFNLSAGNSVAIVAFRFVVCYVLLFDLVFKVFALSVSVPLSPAVQHVVRQFCNTRAFEMQIAPMYVCVSVCVRTAD